MMLRKRHEVYQCGALTLTVTNTNTNITNIIGFVHSCAGQVGAQLTCVIKNPLSLVLALHLLTVMEQHVCNMVMFLPTDV